MNEWNENLERELWEPGATESRLELERRLHPLRFDASAHPLPYSRLEKVKKPILRRPGAWVAGLAAAAVLALLASSALLDFRLRWPEGRAWTVASAKGDRHGRLAVGDTLATGASESALVRVARVGWMRVLEDSRLTLRGTGSRRHRLALESGSVHVSVWAPPFTLFVSTPSGEVMDMGCEFVVAANHEATSLRVLSGWVQLENRYGDVLVPEGASSRMTKHARPSVPVFEDASDRFREAVRLAEEGDSESLEEALGTIVAQARTRDALTLLLLATRVPEARERLLLRAHSLHPVVETGTMILAVEGSDRAVWQWIRQLPLPSPKEWKRNWRDAFRPPMAEDPQIPKEVKRAL